MLVASLMIVVMAVSIVIGILLVMITIMNNVCEADHASRIFAQTIHRDTVLVIACDSISSSGTFRVKK